MPKEQEDRIELGRRIKATRQAKGLTGKELAARARISPSYLSEVERGASAISSEKLLRIARHLKVGLGFLLEGHPQPAGSENGIHVPAALAEAAEQINLSYTATVRLLQGYQSLIARRSSAEEKEWQTQDWIEFYQRVKDYIET